MSKIYKYIIALVLLAVVLYTTQFVKPLPTTVIPVSASDNAILDLMNSGTKLNLIDTLYTPIYTKLSATELTQTRNQRIASLVSYLKRVGSPIATEHYAALIIDLAEGQGVDYRIPVALMGTESGWCKSPIYYNCFGYLNGVHYTSFDDVFNHLIPKISKQYFIRYGWNFAGFVAQYGQISDEAAYIYGRKMYSIAIKLFY